MPSFGAQTWKWTLHLALLQAFSINALWLDTAVCIAGPVTRLPSRDSLQRLQAVSATLSADVYAVLATRGVQQTLPQELQGWLSGHQFYPDGVGPSSVRRDYARANPRNRSGDLLVAYASVGGNFLGPLVGNDGRNAFLLRDLWRCLKLVSSHEQQRGRKYRYLAFSRLDLHWFAPPPPIEVLHAADKHAVWIPDGQDWDGLNDRFAVVPRRWGNAYFGRWPALLNGSMLRDVQQAAGTGLLDLKFDAGPEWLLRASLHSAGVPVRRFSPVAAVVCQPGSHRGRYGRCTRAQPPSGLSFKYSSEVSEAHANAARLQRAGWSWRTSVAPQLQPSCFESEVQQRACCSSSAGLNGDANCWTDVYSYARCCSRERAGLWVLPTSLEARLLLSEYAGPKCWGVVAEVEMCLGQDTLKNLS